MADVTRAIWVKKNGVWKSITKPSVKDGGVWKDIRGGWVKKDGAWQQFYPGIGSIAFSNPGTYSWVVPPGIVTVTVDIVGGGGGGGGSTEVGNGGGGGGGGSGGFALAQPFAVVPGETLTIIVGAGGFGAPFVGRNPGSVAAEGPGRPGGDSSINGSLGALVATGGIGGGSATSNGGGAGGAGGTPTGNSGENGSTAPGETDSYGGAGGSTPLGTGGTSPTIDPYAPQGNPGKGPGAGGSGASAKNYQGPFNWAGGDGAPGVVGISWGGSAMPPGA